MVDRITKLFEIIECDVLVVGGGIAGLRAAIEAAKRRAKVILVNKGILARSGLSVMAGGGMAVVVGNEPKDSPEVHFEDTVIMGHYLGDQNLVEVLVYEAPQRAWRELEELGVKGPIPEYMNSSIGHSYRRGLFIPGHTMTTALRKEALRHSNISILEDYMVTSLLSCDGKIAGATGFKIRDGEFIVFRAKSVVLATGGVGELYSLSSDSPHGLAGDSAGTGVALACHIGAELVDMEMIQFYPSCIVYPHIARGLNLSYEVAFALLGGKIFNKKGEEFLLHERPLTRDIITTRIYEEIKERRGSEHGGVYLDVTQTPLSKEEIERNIAIYYKPMYNHLKLIGIDITKQRMEIRPAPLFACGGIKINEKTETNIHGLYAAGEVSGNIHGANRLCGNALTETLVFGAKAGQYSTDYAKQVEIPEIYMKEIKEEHDRIFKLLEPKREGIRPIELKVKIQNIMDNYLGVVRNEKGLKNTIEAINEMRKNDLPRVQVVNVKRYNLEWVEAILISLMLDTAEIIAKSAILRTESRGCHQRDDYAKKDDKNWLRHTIVKLENGAMKLATAPIIMTKLKPQGK